MKKVDTAQHGERSAGVGPTCLVHRREGGSLHLMASDKGILIILFDFVHLLSSLTVTSRHTWFSYSTLPPFLLDSAVSGSPHFQEIGGIHTLSL